MQLYLIRHPRPDVAEGLCYGRSNLGLAEDAAQVAERLRPLLPAEAVVYSSPLSRCRALAEALHGAPRFSEQLVEMDFGAWEMRPWDALPRAELDAWAADMLGYRPPGGETVAEMHTRAQAFVAALPPGAPAVVVCHAGIMKSLCGHLLDLPLATWVGLTFDFGTVSRLDLSASGWQWLWHNKT